MRVICRQCGSLMKSLGPSSSQGGALEFACACASGIYLAVNDGEAILVKSMGAKPVPEDAGRPSGSASMAAAGSSPGKANGGLPWSPEARERAERIPESVRPMVIRAVAGYAERNGFSEVTGAVLDGFKASKGYMG